MRPFKIRCSAIGEIMAYPDKNELPKGAITYLHTWVKEQVYNRKKEFTSKYTDKGICCEDDAIDMLADYYGWGLVTKNDEMYQDEYTTGTPDLVLSDLIPDIKNSWDCFSFPLFDTKLDTGYEWQMQGYMNLTGRNNAAVIYVLMDATIEIINDEARRNMYNLNLPEVTTDLYNKVKANMTYSHLPVELRVKRFNVKRDDKKIKQIKDRVQLCREYIKDLDLFNKLLNQNLKAA